MQRRCSGAGGATCASRALPGRYPGAQMCRRLPPLPACPPAHAMLMMKCPNTNKVPFTPAALLALLSRNIILTLRLMNAVIARKLHSVIAAWQTLADT